MRKTYTGFQLGFSLATVTLIAMAPQALGQSGHPASKNPVVSRTTPATVKPAPARKATPAPNTVVKQAPPASTGPATAIASKPAAEDDFQHAHRVAILTISGPTIFDIDADEIWKIKNGMSEPGQGELVQLSRYLRDSLNHQLSIRIGATLVPENEVDRVATRVAPSVGSTLYQQQLAKELKARYLVDGSIDRVEFDGNTVLPDVYSMTASIRIIDATNGQVVWSENARKFRSKIYTKKSAKTVMQNFTENQLPDLASYFAARVAQALGR